MLPAGGDGAGTGGGEGAGSGGGAGGAPAELGQEGSELAPERVWQPEPREEMGPLAAHHPVTGAAVSSSNWMRAGGFGAVDSGDDRMGPYLLGPFPGSDIFFGQAGGGIQSLLRFPIKGEEKGRVVLGKKNGGMEGLKKIGEEGRQRDDEEVKEGKGRPRWSWTQQSGGRARRTDLGQSVDRARPGNTRERCPRVEEDIKNGLVWREMTAEGRPAYYLPDNARVHYDRTRTFRSVVAAHSSKVPLEKFTTQVAEFVEPRVQEAGIIHLPQPLPAKEDSFVGCISLVHPKEEEEDERKIMEVDLGKRFRVHKENALEPGPSRKREKATAVPGEEEEEEDYEEIQQEQGEGKEEAVVTMKLTPREHKRILKVRKRAATLLKERPRHLESQLGREYPGAINRTLKTILDTEVTQMLGNLLLTSSAVAEGLKRQMTRKRVPSVVDVVQVTLKVVDWEADSDVEDTLPCTPLGFLEVTVGKHRTKGLVDSGSMINVIPEELARKWGLAMVGSEMKLRGVGGHLTSLLGVVEGCPVGFKGKMESTGVTSYLGGPL
ncbi:hypothetical protein BY996DRAFT_6542051 [Phakopsora pachyrhizi]|nr:hypothetical protein BY996DRAFT_6542051 [Phakopsora pachyrhizi]